MCFEAMRLYSSNIVFWDPSLCISAFARQQKNEHISIFGIFYTSLISGRLSPLGLSEEVVVEAVVVASSS